MEKVHSLFEQAVSYENRSQIGKSEVLYRELADSPDLPSYILQRTCQFFYSLKNYEMTYFLSKELIQRGESLEIFGTLFFDSAKASSDAFVDDIEWLLEQRINELDFSLYFECLKVRKGKKHDVYLRLIDLYEKVAKQFDVHGQAYSRLYNDITLTLIAEEYHQHNITQARYHLRKLLALHRDDVIFTNKIAEWAIVLDLVPALLSRKDCISLKQSLDEPIKKFIEFYENIGQQQFDEQLVHDFKSLELSEMLSEKRTIYFMYCKKLVTNQLSKEELQYLIKHPYDWLAVQLVVTEGGVKAYPFLESAFLYHADLPEALLYYDQLTKIVHVKEKKDVSNVEVTVLGGGHKIGGTSILISIDNHHLLLDAGIHLDQSEQIFPNYSPLEEKSLTFEDIDGVIVSHAHLDHTGAIPHVHRLGPNLPIYSTEATRDLMSILLKDLWRNSQSLPEFYSEKDLQSALLHIDTKRMNESFFVPSKGKKWKITFLEAGHILGAAAVLIELDDKKILFTGDYSIEDQLTVKGAQFAKNLQVDVVISESTYGYAPLQASLPRKRQEEQLLQFIEETIKRDGSVLIPAFALGRAQEILLIIKERFKAEEYLPYIVYTDGLVPNICRVYEKHLGQRSLFFTGGIQSVKDQYKGCSFEEMYSQMMRNSKKVIVASSGMLQSGSASSRYALQMLEHPNNSIAFTGYVDEESPGFALQRLQEQTDRKLTIGQAEVDVKASVKGFKLSAHASREEMVQTIISLQPEVVMLVHGEHHKKYVAPRAFESLNVFPTIIDLLSELPLTVVPAVNGESYGMKLFS
ncbi:MBL fold metallo-hydrolase [Litchfieldia alkalitelluris]|uniref:MBL fold metallo-hydrolase n=1 Tax=Litchfieldia alkalitelluris TaxID=304268 RepID=UPI000995FBEC|nr:MBL fold metallo-hydrolase [Litchfieldia alkalitelluris]